MSTFIPPKGMRIAAERASFYIAMARASPEAQGSIWLIEAGLIIKALLEEGADEHGFVDVPQPGVELKKPEQDHEDAWSPWLQLYGRFMGVDGLNKQYPPKADEMPSFERAMRAPEGRVRAALGFDPLSREASDLDQPSSAFSRARIIIRKPWRD